MDLARRAEELGYDRIWLYDSAAITIKSPSYKLDNGSLGFVNEPFVLSANGLGMPKVNTGGLLFGDLFVIFNIVSIKQLVSINNSTFTNIFF